MRKLLLTLFLINFCASLYAQEPNDIKNAKTVIGNMHKKYAGKWHENLTFVQQTTFYKNGKPEREETWYEAMKLPDALVIKFGNLASGNGLLFKSDSQFVFKEDKLVSKMKKVHDLMVLGFSVYGQQPEVTIKKLSDLGYDFNFFELDLNGDAIECAIGNPDQAQFWIDDESLLFKRLKKIKKDGSVSEVIFNKYEKLGGGWVATEVLFLENGKVVMKEVYRDIKAPKQLPDTLWNATDFASHRW